MEPEDADAPSAHVKKIHVVKRIHRRAHSNVNKVRGSMEGYGILPKITPVKPTTFIALVILCAIPPVFFIGLFSVSSKEVS